jgi:curved DNA-binding protein CbpA
LIVPRDFYQILSIERTATPDQIRSRFLQLARERHPDRFSGADRARAETEFQEITEAFNVLSQPERRRQHDFQLSRNRAESTESESLKLLRFHLEAGNAFYRDANYFAAAESFERALHLEPKNHLAWVRLAQALSHQRKLLPRAVEAAAKACELQPVNPDYLRLAGRLCVEAGLLDRAERYYNEAQNWGGEDPVVLKALEELRSRMRKSRSALFGKES